MFAEDQKTAVLRRYAELHLAVRHYQDLRYKQRRDEECELDHADEPDHARLIEAIEERRKAWRDDPLYKHQKEAEWQLEKLMGRMLVTPGLRDDMRIFMVDVTVTACGINTHWQPGVEGIQEGLEQLRDGFEAEPLVQELKEIIGELGLHNTDSGAGMGEIDLGCQCTVAERDAYVAKLWERFEQFICLGVIKVRVGFMLKLEGCSYAPFADPEVFEKFVQDHDIKKAQVTLKK